MRGIAGGPLLVICLLVAPASAQEAGQSRLPLPWESGGNGLTFETRGPPATVLTGFQLPTEGPLTSWAPIFSTLEADGHLRETTPGAWSGPVPARWQKWSRPGFVVAGFRVLIRTKPEPVQTRQVQIFWRAWSEGVARGPLAESLPLGAPARAADTVRIVEITVPEGAIPTGIWGQLLSGSVSQCSLVVRLGSAPSPSPRPGQNFPTVSVPAAPQAPLAPTERLTR